MLSRRVSGLALASGLFLGPLSGALTAQDAHLVATSRFFRGEMTQVEGYVRIDRALLTEFRSDGAAAYRIGVAIRDTLGRELFRSIGFHLVSSARQRGNQHFVEHFAFVVPPGRFHQRSTGFPDRHWFSTALTRPRGGPSRRSPAC